MPTRSCKLRCSYRHDDGGGLEFLETAESRRVPAVGEGYQDEEHEYEGSLVGAKFHANIRSCT